MKCDKCKSKRILDVNGKTSDCFSMLMVGYEEYDGYPPFNMNISESGDGLEFKLCLDCGKIQGKFPILKKEVDEAFNMIDLEGD